MKFLSRSLLTVSAAVFCASRVFAADAVDLKQQFLVGKKYFQTMQMDQASTIAMGEQKMEQKVGMTMDMSTAVTKHEDGKQKRLTVRYERMAMKMNMNGQEMGFDSAKPDDDKMGMGKAMGALVGKDIKALANEKDEITGIENFDEFSAAMAGGPLGAQLGQMFSKESLTEMMKQGGLKGLPNHPVKIGESWPYSYGMKMPQLGNTEIKGNYTLKSVGMHNGVNCAEIAMDGTISMDMSGGGAAAGGDAGAAPMLAAMGMKINGGKLAGTMWFDLALGTTREAKMTQEMEISMKNPTKPDAVLTIPMKQDITVTLTKVEEAK